MAKSNFWVIKINSKDYNVGGQYQYIKIWSSQGGEEEQSKSRSTADEGMSYAEGLSDSRIMGMQHKMGGTMADIPTRVATPTMQLAGDPSYSFGKTARNLPDQASQLSCCVDTFEGQPFWGKNFLGL